ncbi:hypothetical protein GIB67_015232 [Kingdonia uniflora]|uniref:tyrosine--tRNA ligase n=1 Tax=Kingdonia uniflora TaxID=39325 RepID=A0A7J7MSQ7_9MAGN|nr:hypothetical protein GIB67_015232 [Kingdonia uniflora]
MAEERVAISAETIMELQTQNGESSSPSDSNPTLSNGLSLEERFKNVRSISEECIQEDKLKNLLAKKPEPICYYGFEPSGRMHIAQVTISQ